MQYRLAVLPGDGIGREVTSAALTVLKKIESLFSFSTEVEEADIGGAAIDRFGHPLPQRTVEICQASDAVLLGAVGGPKWDNLPGDLRPEAGLLGLRKTLQVFANLRPIRVFPELMDASPLKREVVEGSHFIIVRELTGGLYFGEPKERRQTANGLEVVDTLHYTEDEIERIVRVAFDLATKRRGHLTSVDKANVLESSRVWREVVQRVALDYPQVQVHHQLVDSAAMMMVQKPTFFDVVVTENLFGDILSDEAAVITGSLGMLPSASLSSRGPGLYEPVHGSAPDIAGQNRANPLATLLSLSMLLEHSFSQHEAASVLEKSVLSVISQGYRTADLAGRHHQALSTTEMTERVLAALEDQVGCQTMKSAH